MNIWGKNMPELMKIAKAGKQNFVKSGIIFSVKNGLASWEKPQSTAMRTGLTVQFSNSTEHRFCSMNQGRAQLHP